MLNTNNSPTTQHTMMKKLIDSALIFLLAGFCSQAYTQEQDDKNDPEWYQIELLVFAYESPQNANQELWDPQPELRYPERIVDLQNNATTEIMLNNPSTLDSLSSAAYQSSEAQSSFDQFQQSAPLTESNTPGNTKADDSIDPTREQPEPFVVTLDQQPFTLLEREELTFKKFSRRLARQSDIRTLFHGAWRQPIASREQAENILIYGGDKFDNHFELEGSISLGLERYLHIKTNLWISAFVSNMGVEKNPWPLLPSRPITSTIKTGEETNDPFGTPGLNTKANSLEGLFSNPFEAISNNQYRVDRTVLLQQERRMRSNELHYIDHPLMGLLIRITPYEFPEPEPEPEPELETETEQNAEPELSTYDAEKPSPAEAQ